MRRITNTRRGGIHTFSDAAVANTRAIPPAVATFYFQIDSVSEKIQQQTNVSQLYHYNICVTASCSNAIVDAGHAVAAGNVARIKLLDSK